MNLNKSKLLAAALLAIVSGFQLQAGESVAESSSLTVDLRSQAFKDWLANYYSNGEIQDAAITDSILDTDGDGDSNYFEYLAKQSPTDNLERYRIYVSDPTNGTLRIGPISDPEKTQVEYSTRLEFWIPVLEAYQSLEDNYLVIELANFPEAVFFRAQLSE